MSKLNSNNILFNVAGIGIVVTAIGYMGYTFFITEKVPHCTARFPAGQQFAFESAKGKPLTTIELQARAGLREWGVLQNAKIANGSGVPAGGVMEVSLAATGDEDKADQNGVGFVWPVNELAKAGTACLSYQVFIPGSFKFAEPGYLPGLFGAGDLTQLDESKPSDGFAARVGWDQNGEIGVEVRSPASAGFWQSSTRSMGRSWVRAMIAHISRGVRRQNSDGGYFRSTAKMLKSWPRRPYCPSRRSVPLPPPPVRPFLPDIAPAYTATLPPD